jgi:hypothetical protein
MHVTDMQAAALRAFLVYDSEEAATLTRRLGDTDSPGYEYLALAALSASAKRCFHAGYTHADLVRYIAALRLHRLADGEEYDLDPVIGENVLQSVLGQPVRPTGAPEERFRAVIALLDAFAETGLLTGADADELLAEARELADQWLAEQGR